MKNVIFIIVDSLMYSEIGRKYGNVSVTPFFDKIKNSCINFENLYSQGPYTEAGTKPLSCAENCLDNYGYMFRFDKAKYYITDIFKYLGYKTSAIMYPTTLYSKKTIDNIDNIFFSSVLLFNVIWEQKLLYYRNLMLKSSITDVDYEIVIDLVKICFDSFDNFFNSKEESYCLINDLIKDYPLSYYDDIIKSEYVKFNENPKKYVDLLLMNGDKHIFNEISKIDFKKLIKNNEISMAFNYNKTFFKKLKNIQRKSAIKNSLLTNGVLIKGFSRLLKGNDIKYAFGEYLYKYKLINSWRDVKTCKTQSNYKLIVSADRQIELAKKILLNKNENNFVLMHLEEPHYFTTYFSYDSTDVKKIQEELLYAEEFLDGIDPKTYRGMLSYQLSIRYIDKKIESLFEFLNSNNILKDTTVVITADHGSSYNYVPIRNRTVINFHSENYHVPLIIYSNNFKTGYSVSKLGSSRDVIPTLLDLLGYKFDRLESNSLLKAENKLYEYTLIEFMGSGCPDMKRKPVWLAVKSFKYLVAYVGKLKDKFDEKNIVEIYDLEKDPLELENIVNFRNEEVKFLINCMKNRFEEIYRNNYEWIEK